MKVIDICGFTVLFQHKPTETITVRAIVNTGSANEVSESDRGVSHFLEHMFFKGTENKGYQQINKELDYLGEHNAYTSYDRTGYYINCLPSGFKQATNLLGELLYESVFDDDEFEKERGVIIEEYQMYLDDPSSYFSNTAIESIWNDPGHSIIGTKDSVSNMSVSQLKAYKDKHYGKKNTIFIVVGNATEDVAVATLTEMLSKYTVPEGELSQLTDNTLNLEDCHFSHASTQSIIELVMKAYTPSEVRTNHFANNVFHQGFGASSHSLLFDRIREQLGLCYSIGSYEGGIGPYRHLGIYTMLDAKNVDLAREEIMKQLVKVQKSGLSKESLDISKQHALFGLAGKVESVTQFAFMFCDRFHVWGDLAPEEIKEGVLATTNEDVIEYANSIDSDGVKFICMNGKE